MHRLFVRPLALATGSLFTLFVAQAQYASSVVNYSAGTGGAAGYDNPATALGEPSRVTPGDFGGPVDPFAPPYLNSQLVSLGKGGSLTVQLATPIGNDPAHPYGVDFLLFGNTGFIVANEYDAEGNVIGIPATDGLTFPDPVVSRISVSADGLTFFTLNPDLAPLLDALFPTDGSGQFGTSVNPGLSGSSFAGLTLEGIRSLYAGSGGGLGFDLAWAQDAEGHPVALPEVNFIRVDVLDGKAEIDGFSGITAVPEPATWALFAVGLGLVIAWRRR